MIRFLLMGIILTTLPGEAYTVDNYKKKREIMVHQQIKGRGIKNLSVLKAMREIPRHLFVPKAYRHLAYEDTPLPIGYGQTISQPYMAAVMTALIRINSKSRVLKIGTGSGYQAAVLSKIAKKVYTIEIHKKLGGSARKHLKRLNYNNVKVKIGDGYKGWAKHKPYDAILVTCASDSVPLSLKRQLKKGGVMCIPVGGAGEVQKLYVIRKNQKGKLVKQFVFEVRFVPLVRE